MDKTKDKLSACDNQDKYRNYKFKKSRLKTPMNANPSNSITEISSSGTAETALAVNHETPLPVLLCTLIAIEDALRLTEPLATVAPLKLLKVEAVNPDISKVSDSPPISLNASVVTSFALSNAL